jgi:hypothetical protein
MRVQVYSMSGGSPEDVIANGSWEPGADSGIHREADGTYNLSLRLSGVATDHRARLYMSVAEAENLLATVKSQLIRVRQWELARAEEQAYLKRRAA